MLYISTIKALIAVMALCVVLGVWSARASAQVIDCDTGGSIKTAIDAGETAIQFTGTCNEFVLVHRDGTFIEGVSGNPALDVVSGGLNVWGAQGVQIQNLTVTGNGFFISGSAYVTLVNSIVQNTDYGFGVFRNSAAILQGNTFGPALIDDAAESCLPICVGENSYARLQNNTVNGATDSGAVLDVYRHSSILIRGGNTITNSGTGSVLSANQGSLIRQDDALDDGTDQITGDVRVYSDSVLDTRQAVITGEVSVRLDSILRTGTSFGGDPSLMRIDGGIALSQDSALVIESPQVTINGDVTCADDESSVEGSFAGTGNNLCSGFSSVENDFNGDGKADLLWRHSETGAVAIWLMDGSTAKQADLIAVVPDLNWIIVKVEDFNGDGKADLFWRNRTSGDNYLWLIDGFAITPLPVPGAPVGWELQP